jgi:hypothetical protein
LGIEGKKIFDKTLFIDYTILTIENTKLIDNQGKDKARCESIRAKLI